MAVLTPYKAQLRLLKRTFKQHGGTAAVEAVHFATVDGYQGREADVVIFSCVRCGHWRYRPATLQLRYRTACWQAAMQSPPLCPPCALVVRAGTGAQP